MPRHRQPRWSDRNARMPYAEGMQRPSPGGFPRPIPQSYGPAAWREDPRQGNNGTQGDLGNNATHAGQPQQSAGMAQGDQSQQYDGFPSYPTPQEQAQGFAPQERGFVPQAQRFDPYSSRPPPFGRGMQQNFAPPAQGFQQNPFTQQGPRPPHVADLWVPQPVVDPKTLPTGPFPPDEARAIKARDAQAKKAHKAFVKDLGEYNKWYWGELAKKKERGELP